LDNDEVEAASILASDDIEGFVLRTEVDVDDADDVDGGGGCNDNDIGSA